MKRYQKIVSVALAIVMLLGPEWPSFVRSLYAQPANINPPRTTVGLKPLVDQLMAVTSDTTDTDGDGMPDSVEAVIGTDPNNTDSDFDKLADSWEIDNDLDPMEPDSNFDGMPDYLEVTDVPSMDIDGDGFINAWDYDNDGDGVNDAADLSPSSKTQLQDQFHFDITTDGNPTFITFQLRPSNSEYLRLYGRVWDWPNTDRQGSIQDWDNSKEDVKIFPILQLSVNTAPEISDVILQGIIIEDNIVSIPLMPISEHGNIVAFGGRLPYPTTTPQNLTMDAKLVWKVVGSIDPNAAELEVQTVLASYNDSFSITGMTAEESAGTETGIFYSADINQTIAANLLMSYQFVRDSDRHLADMPSILDANNVDVSQMMAAFEHKDEALANLNNQMIPSALESLPADVNLPVITLMEDSFACLDLSEFNAASPDSFLVDVTSQPILISKSLKTNWYNTSGSQAMETGDIMAEIAGLGLPENSTSGLMQLMLCWNTGEQSLEGLGLPQTDPGDDFILIPNVAEQIVGGGLVGLEILFRSKLAAAGLDSYKFVKFLQSKGWSAALGASDIADLAKAGKWTKFKAWVNQCSVLKENGKLFKKIDKALDALDIATMLLDTGFAVYSIIAISQMDDLDGIALFSAVMQVTLKYYIDCMLFLVNMIPYVGWLIALAAEIGDIFGGWSDKAVTAIIEAISEVDYSVTPSIAIAGDPWITLNDNDNNGTDAGDRIEYKSRLKSTLQGSGSAYASWETMWGSTETGWGLIMDSEIYPYYKIYGPAGSNSTTGYCYQQTLDYVSLPVNPFSWTHSSDRNAALPWESYEYESGVWIEPGKGMVNFPIYIELNSKYEMWYLWSWYSWLFWDWGWQYVPGWKDGSLVHGGDTFYVDVMPGTLQDFVNWKEIACLDNDGDGINNAQETTSNPRLSDSDSDGLSDKFEIDNGLNPRAHDTDGDALIDWFEVQFDMDPANPDGDGDGISDYIEIAGWIIQFEYAGQTFTTRVYSDPMISDTDADGVDDYQEYFSGLNPRSGDTNGDGVKDEPRTPAPETTIEFVKKVDLQFASEDEYRAINDIAVDQNGFVYALVTTYTDPGYGPTGVVYVYDSNLNEYNRWHYYAADPLTGNMLIDNDNRLIHIGFRQDLTPSIWWDQEQNSITTLTLDGGWMGGPDIIWAHRPEVDGVGRLALERDTNGSIYAARSGVWTHYNDMSMGCVSVIDVYDSNRNRINTWGGFASNSEIDKLTYVQDMAYNPVNGYLYMAEFGNVWQPYRPNRISIFTTAGQYIQDLPGYHKDGVDYNFAYPVSIETDSEGNIYICDGGTRHLYKFDINGMPVLYGFEEGHFRGTIGKAVMDQNKNIFVWELNDRYDYLEHLHKFREVTAEPNEPVIVPDTNPDRDGDSLLNDTETAGWDITFTDPNGTQTITIASDPMLADTDLDGLTDYQEQQFGSNPQDPDTDHDGIGDFAEVQAGTNPNHYDTDSDGLADGDESAFGSNPCNTDTDGDGLLDAQEFALGTNPNNPDTDGDGLNDGDEITHNANPLSPDTDGDFVFDGQEVNQGTDPNNSDMDNDGLSDGIETVVHNTDPASDDSDNDGISDSNEIERSLDPLSDDTDGDGIKDGTELDNGTNPFIADSDHDGIPDDQDITDNLPPDVSNTYPSQEFLWPANNKFIPITIEGVTDPEGDPFHIGIESVTCDEESSLAYGRKEKDAYISEEDGLLYLKAERDARGNGRVYEITFVAVDDKGEYSRGKVQVKVPHSKRKNTYKCIDDGQQYEVVTLVPNQAPDISAAYMTVQSLGTVDLKFVKMNIMGVTDPDGDNVKITITKITSDEPVAYSIWDKNRPDAWIQKITSTVFLRAECDPKGNGRVYEISFTAKDSHGNTTNGSLKVNVPLSGSGLCIDDGQNYNPLDGRWKEYWTLPR